MRDRDKKILLLLVIVGVALLPYFMYIKQTKVDTEALVNDNVRLEKRLRELEEMNKHRDEYIAKTAEYEEKMLEIINKFPADVVPENYVMFLLGTEIHTTKFDEEKQKIVVEKPIYFDEYEMTSNVETPIEATDVSTNSAAIQTIDDVSTGYIAKANESNLAFRTQYNGFKDIILFLNEYKDPMVYRSFEVVFDKKTGMLDGKMKLAQYAIAGPDRALDPPSFSYTFDGIEEPFNYDLDELELRGNCDKQGEDGKIIAGVGIFGPKDDYNPEDEENIVDDPNLLEDGGDDAAADGDEAADDASGDNDAADDGDTEADE